MNFSDIYPMFETSKTYDMISSSYDDTSAETATAVNLTMLQSKTFTTIKNGSNFESLPVDPALLESFTKNRSIEDPWYHILIVMYSALIVFGAFGNMLVVAAVVRKPIMRTARNLFILNLAVSDLILCVVTMPLTLMEIESKFWPFGNCAILCKMIAMLQALSIYVSTISIIAIAFDRYQVIVYPTHDSLQIVGAVCTLVCIWLLAVLLASPMFIYKRLIHADIPPVLHSVGIADVSFCIEDWPMNHGRFYYSIFSLCVQYMVPILVVTIAYCGIYNKLKSRITVVSVNTTQRKSERGRRIKRTNCLLVSISLIFGVSWLPLNFFNLYADMRRSIVTQNMLVTYAICHMIGMSSACSNPLLYGWLNDNFRKEFQTLLCRCKENTNITLNGHSTGSGQPRRMRRQTENSGADVKPLTSGVICGGIDKENVGNGSKPTSASTVAGEVHMNTFIGIVNNNGVRLSKSESMTLIQNPMTQAVTILTPT